MKDQVARSGRAPTVAITRSREGNSKLASKLRERGFEPVEIETLEFLPPRNWSTVDSILTKLEGYDWLVFTSATGGKFFAARMEQLSISLRWKGKPRVAAVGERTRAALETAGVRVDFVPSSYLTRKLAEELPRSAGMHLLVVRADIGEPGFVPALESEGFNVDDLPVYRTSLVRGGAITQTVDAIIFASPSAVEAFMKRPGTKDSSNLRDALALCIGPVTATAARKAGFARILSSKVHTLDGVVDRLEEVAVGATSC